MGCLQWRFVDYYSSLVVRGGIQHRKKSGGEFRLPHSSSLLVCFLSPSWTGAEVFVSGLLAGSREIAKSLIT